MVFLKRNVSMQFYLSPALMSMINVIILKDANFQRVVSITDFLATCLKKYLQKHNIYIETVEYKKIGRITKRFREILTNTKIIKLKDINNYDRDSYFRSFYRITASCTVELEKIGEVPLIKKFTFLRSTDFLHYFTLQCYRDIVLAEQDEKELEIVEKMIEFYDKEIAVVAKYIER